VPRDGYQIATISKTKTGKFKAVARRKKKNIKTNTFKLKKHAWEWARKIEADADLIKLADIKGALLTIRYITSIPHILRMVLTLHIDERNLRIICGE
jgi:hypothetical protein